MNIIGGEGEGRKGNGLSADGRGGWWITEGMRKKAWQCPERVSMQKAKASPSVVCVWVCVFVCGCVCLCVGVCVWVCLVYVCVIAILPGSSFFNFFNAEILMTNIDIHAYSWLCPGNLLWGWFLVSLAMHIWALVECFISGATWILFFKSENYLTALYCWISPPPQENNVSHGWNDCWNPELFLPQFVHLLLHLGRNDEESYFSHFSKSSIFSYVHAKQCRKVN